MRRTPSPSPATVQVVVTAERDLPARHVLDGLGGYDTFGVAERAAVTAEQRLLPMGVAEGCCLLRAVTKGTVISYDEVELKAGHLVDKLRLRSAEHFA